KGTRKGEARMSIANPPESAVGSPNSEPSVVAPMTNAAKRRRQHRVVTRLLIVAAVALGFAVLGVAPASADPDAFHDDQNPFGPSRCSCPQTAPPGSPESTEEIRRGLREGHTASVPGLPPPAQPAQPQR